MKNTLFSVLLTFLTCPVVLEAQAGTFDPSFGDNGVVITNVLSSDAYPEEIARTPDQKILSIGNLGPDSIFVLCQDMHGKIDSSFGKNGIRLPSFNAAQNLVATFVEPTNDGLIYVGVNGKTMHDVGLVMRLHSDGTTDSSFANNGTLTMNDFGVSSYVEDAAIDNNGRLLLAGSVGFLGERLLISRYLSSGDPDLSFNNSGYIDVDMYGDFDNAHFVYLLEDDKILVIGRTINLNFPVESMLTAVCLLPDGNLDETFGESGRAYLNFTDFETIPLGALLPDDASILFGYSTGPMTYGLSKLTREGTIDSTFGINGNVTHTSTLYDVNIGYAFAQQSDGRIVFAGINGNDPDFQTNLIRLNADGSIDSTFGDGGMALHDIADSTNFWTAMIILPDDRYLLAGSANIGGLNHHALAVVRSAENVNSFFAPIGATWSHCLQPDIEPGQQNIFVEATDTTSRQGMSCIVVRSDDFWKLGQTTLDSMLICGDGDRYYYAEGDSLHLLYDFSLQAGDTLTLRFPVEMNAHYQEWFPEESLYWKYLVEAVDTIVLDGIPLRRQHLRGEPDPYFNVIPGDWAIERIGYEQWIFPFLSVGESNAYCYLVEYVDDQIHETDTTNQCMSVGSRDQPIDKSLVNFWPNPVHDRLYIETDEQILNILLYSLEGKLVDTDQELLDLSEVPPGVYLLTVIFEDQTVIRKVVKQ